MSPERAHITALGVSQLHADQAQCYRALNMPALALRERTKAIVLYDRVLAHWSATNDGKCLGLRVAGRK